MIMASCKLDSGDTENDLIVCDVCESGEEATSHCDDCLMNLCDTCVLDFHRKLVRKNFHCVRQGVTNYRTELELCPTHGAKMSLYCTTCSARICPECEIKSKEHASHTVISLTEHVEKEKEKLLGKLDEVASKTETISYFPDEIRDTAIRIELGWMERKEQLLQEFTSLYDLIIAKQQELLQTMEGEVRKAIQELKTVSEAHEKITYDICQLSDECIAAIQHQAHKEFLGNFPQLMESLQNLEGRVSGMASPMCFIPTFLKMPFSFYKEKCHLDRSLGFPVFNCLQLKPKEFIRFIPYERLQDSVTLKELIHAPVTNCLPPSSVMRYKVEVCGSGYERQVSQSYTQENLKASAIVLNSPISGHRLEPGSRYKVRVTPVLVVSKQCGTEDVLGEAVSILVVTGFPEVGAVPYSLDLACGDKYDAPAEAPGSAFNVSNKKEAKSRPQRAPRRRSLSSKPPGRRQNCNSADNDGNINNNKSDNNNHSSSNRDDISNDSNRLKPPCLKRPEFPINGPHILTPHRDIGDVYTLTGFCHPFEEQHSITSAIKRNIHDNGYLPLHQCERCQIEVSFEEARLLQDKRLQLMKVQSLAQ